MANSLLNRLMRVVVMLVMLAGCAESRADLTLDLKRGERWQMTAIVVIPLDAIRNYPGGVDAIKRDMASAVRAIRAHGVSAKASDQLTDSDWIYTISSAGNGYEQLRGAWRASCDMDAIEDGGQIWLSLRCPMDTDLPVERLEIRASEIQAGNGNRVNAGAMVWNNPEYIDVTIVNRSASPWRYVKWIGLGLLGTAVLAYVLYKLAHRAPRLPATFCPECDALIPEDQVLCPICGMPR